MMPSGIRNAMEQQASVMYVGATARRCAYLPSSMSLAAAR
jgi:hypothetical protein